MLITTTEQLQAVCERFATEPFVTMDTEFIRERTYYPELCLIQIASKKEAFCIDPLSKELDMSPLFTLMKNPHVVKVFHAARQDLEIFYQLMHELPHPLFDTQIGAMVCGFGESVSYQQLVNSFCHENIDKSMRYTDWSRRPLNEKQVKYALYDVTYLVPIYEQMTAQLAENGRLDWVKEEIATLNDPKTYVADKASLWKKMRSPLKKPLQLAILSKLCIYREELAQKKNRPRRHIFKDELLMEMAGTMPHSKEEMAAMRSLPSGFITSSYASEILSIIRKTEQEDVSAFKVKDRPSLTSTQHNLAVMLSFLLDLVAEEAGVAPKLLASNDDIHQLVYSDFDAENPCLNGWRKPIFGDKAVALSQGKLCITFDPVKKKAAFILTQ